MSSDKQEVQDDYKKQGTGGSYKKQNTGGGIKTMGSSSLRMSGGRHNTLRRASLKTASQIAEAIEDPDVEGTNYNMLTKLRQNL